MITESINDVETNWQQTNYDSLLAEVSLLKQTLRKKLSDEGQSRLKSRLKNQLKSEAESELQEIAAAEKQPIPVLHHMGESGVGTSSANTLAFATDSIPSVNQNEILYKSVIGNGNDREWLKSPKQTSVMLNNLRNLFGLSLFDRQLLLLCVGMELDPEIPVLCMELTQQPFPSLSLALMCLDGHCSALAPESPLVYFRLIEPKQNGSSFIRTNLAISQWVLFYLVGTPIMEPSLSNCMHSVKLIEPMLPTQLESAERIGQLLEYSDDISADSLMSDVINRDADNAVIVQLISSAVDEQRQVAALFAKSQERDVFEFSLYDVPLRTDEQESLQRQLAREIISRQCLLFIDCSRLLSEAESKVNIYSLRNWLDRLIRFFPKAFLLHAAEKIELSKLTIHYQNLPALSSQEQLLLWRHCLPKNNLDEILASLSELTSLYTLTGTQVRSIARNAIADQCVSKTGSVDSENLKKKLWQHSREQSRHNLHGLAQVIAPGSLGWDDLILADREKRILQSVVSQFRQRQQVYHEWGFAKQVSYGLGMCALFAGGSGTGKTLAARVIASKLNLDVYQVDLSSVVDKYIGETEKKLDRLFQAAEDSGAILLFDEADALFGKRTKVQDARDRYANMGVSFLLQRMERYSGLSILTTNFRSAMDAAFMRRLRFIVQFPFPTDQERQQIWQRMMSSSAPTKDIDYQKLARLVLAGGAIRNIILQAAFLAAEANQSITMQCLYEAVRQEYIKAEKTLDASLVQDW